MSPRLIPTGLALLLTLVGAGACRDPAELNETISAVLVVVGLDEGNVVEVEIADASRRSAPKAGDNLVSFNLPLPVGTHVGTIVVFEVEDDGEKPHECGTVTIVVPEQTADDGPVLVAVVADDLGECPEEEDVEDEAVEDRSAQDDPVDDGP